MTRLVRAALPFALLVWASPAHAHGSAQLGDFYEGLFQPFFHPEFLLAALALALWSTQQAPRTAFAICAGFAGGVVAGSVAAWIGVTAPASVWGPRIVALGVGSLVSLRARVPLALGTAAGVVAGLFQGHAGTAAELDQLTRPVFWALGLGFGAMLLGVYANGLTTRYPTFWMGVAVRIVGSWITAIGLLVTVMAVRAI